ncbi:hypothetical protein [Denitrobacterium detoxificans]|uniref:hypothetical protein n=1 Tax=Denitrobacterium detoxificans TaxID=79604 RepID=UPI0026E920B9|nr:hypothetical protein [Denitrobacterium detoxificans]MBE6466702.1 hypothetical protein [Denitrobacterium detoxificans]
MPTSFPSDDNAMGTPSPARRLLAQYAAITLCFVFAILATFAMGGHLPLQPCDETTGVSYTEWNHHYVDDDQYARLGDALLHGRVTLDLPVDEQLAQLDNPYAFTPRYEIGDINHPIFWDHAFYQGNYYSYFGVIPAVALYAPFQLVTGTWLSTPAAVLLASIVALLAGAFMVWQLGRRFFSGLPGIGMLTLALGTYFVGSNITYHLIVPWFYSMPILFSLAATALGMGFWLKARRSDGTLSAACIATGSFFMALNLGCRPQFILVSLLALVLFRKEIFRERTLFSRSGLRQTIAAILPYVLVFAPLLAYNYARFGSLTDFGSNYNLTGFDMTTYVQSKKVTLYLMAEYLFALPDPSAAFPFLAEITTLPEWCEWAPNEPFYAGYFFIKPIMLVVVALPFCWKKLKASSFAPIVICSAALALVVLFVDTRVAGITERYFSDFGWYITLIALLAMFAMRQKFDEAPLKRRAFCAVCGILVGISILLGVLTGFSAGHYWTFISTNPDFATSIYALFGNPL